MRLTEKLFQAAAKLKKKRFYKAVDVVGNVQGTSFEICLDNRKIRTPNGSTLQVPNETLALAIANEWDTQRKFIELRRMHLTNLCFTCIDNPWQRTKSSMIESILRFLENDTILFLEKDQANLRKHQLDNWGPILDFVNQRYGTDLEFCSSFLGPQINAATLEAVAKHLRGFEFWPLNGFLFCTESLKSFLMTMALSDHEVSVDRAVSLANLEQNWQAMSWGRVEWAHDIERFESSARAAAGALFVGLTQTKRHQITQISSRLPSANQNLVSQMNEFRLTNHSQVPQKDESHSTNQA